jgi:hypothetical protein
MRWVQWLMFVFAGLSQGHVLCQSPRWHNPILDRAIEPRVILGGGLIFQAPRWAEGTLNNAMGGPGYGLQVDAGISFVVHDRWGLDVIGGYARQSTLYWIVDTSCWAITVPALRGEARLWRSFPLALFESGELKVGLALGMDHQTAGDRDRNDGTIGVRSKWEDLSHSYLAFELGWWNKHDWDRSELAFRYVRHLPRNPAYTAVVYQDAATRSYTSTQDHIGFMYRYHLGLPRRPYRGAAPSDMAHVERTTDTVFTTATRWAMARLQLWDDAEYDGDTVSVILNGMVVLDHHELTHRKTKVKLPLRPGANTVLVVAHNEGRVPPNTAHAVLRTGNRRTNLVLKTNLARNAALRLEYY